MRNSFGKEKEKEQRTENKDHNSFFMLARQCGRRGRLIQHQLTLPLPLPLPQPQLQLQQQQSHIWLTDEFLRREFQSFCCSRVSQSGVRCEFDSEDYSRRLLRRRMSMVRAEATTVKQDQFLVGVGKWDETPPTFSWSFGKSGGGGSSLEGFGLDGSILESQNGARRPKGVHYKLEDTGSTLSHFLSSIFKPIETFFPSRPDDLPPPPPKPLSISTPSSTEALLSLESGILSGKKSVRWIINEHKALKRHSPHLQLSSRTVVSLFQRLLGAGMYHRFLEVLESEDVLAVEGVDLVWLSLEKFESERRKEILEELCEACEKQHRERFRAMLAELEVRVQQELHTAVLKETAQMMSQILASGAPPKEEVFAMEIAGATDVKMLCGINDRIITSGVGIGIETSRAIFQRFVDLGGIDDSLKYALNPLINVPGTNNIGRLCELLCDMVRYRDAYKLIMAALKVEKFGFLSDLDVRAGIRGVDRTSVRTEEELVDLWEALNASQAITIRDITKNTFAAFIGRACRLKFGRKSQWWEGNGATVLLKMCMEIIILRLQGNVDINHLATLVEAWVWNWQGNEDKRVDVMSLDESIPFLSHFLDVLSQEQLDQLFTMTINRITMNCQRKGDEIFPVRVLWPFLASVAQSRLWKNEESIALWALEGVVLRKGLAPKYLAFRSDPEIARFVVRHYLPFRMAIEGQDGSEKEKAKAVFIKLRKMEMQGVGMDPDTRSGIEMGIETGRESRLSPFATAILAFKGTGVPCRTLLLDMVYTLYRLGQHHEIVRMLYSLNSYGIRPSSSQYALLIRTMTADHPESALAMLKIYAKSQYSTFASYIATVASKHPHLALSAYRFLTRPNKFPFTPDQPSVAPRRLPKRRLLVAMAWKFANSPALTARQCHRWVHICYGTMLKLGYAPGPTMGLAIAVAAVQRTIREGIPVRITSARQKWVLRAVRRQAGVKKAEEVASILKRWEEKMWQEKRREKQFQEQRW